MKRKKLKPQHLRFAEAILAGMSETDAYLAAGYRVKRTTAAANGHKLLNKTEIARLIARRQQLAADRADVKRARLLQELGRLALSDLTNVVQMRGRSFVVQSLDELGPDVTAAIQEIAKTKDGIRVKLHPKHPAIELLGRERGMFKQLLGGTIGVSVEATKTADLKTELEALLANPDVRKYLLDAAKRAAGAEPAKPASHTSRRAD
jgi:hypothetical protein